MINHVDELRKTFIHIMTHGCKNNTYKFALARFFLDYCNMMPTSRLSTMSENNEKIIIHYEEIADAFLRYYWHQEFRYRIKQNFYNERPPSVVKILRDTFWNRGTTKDVFIRACPNTFFNIFFLAIFVKSFFC